MGSCVSSNVSAHDRRAYHGVAVSLSSYPYSLTAGGREETTSQGEPKHKDSNDTLARAKKSDKFYGDFSVAFQERLRRCCVHTWKPANPSSKLHRTSSSQLHREPRYDHLTSFGGRQIFMVDELTSSLSSSTDRATSSAALSTSASHTTWSSLSTSGRASTPNPGSVYIEQQTSLNLSHGSPALSSMTQGAASSCSSVSHVPTPSSVGLGYRIEAGRLHDYTLSPCNCGHAYRTKLVLFCAKMNILFSCSAKERHVLAYHMGLGTEVGRLTGHNDVIVGGAIHPEASVIATASRDGTVILWELPSCKQRRSLSHPGPVNACCFSSSGTELATACADGLCRVWAWSAADFTNAHVLSATDSPSPLTSVTYSLGDRAILAAGAARAVYIWDRPNLSAAVLVFLQHKGAVLSVDASRTLPNIVVSSEEATVFVWNCATLETLSRIDVDLCVARTRLSRHRLEPCLPPVGSLSSSSRTVYWTTVRLFDSFFGLVVVAATSDKRVFLFRVPKQAYVGDGGNTRQTNSYTSTLPNFLVDVLSLDFAATVESIYVGSPNQIILGDACGNRYALELR